MLEQLAPADRVAFATAQDKIHDGHELAYVLGQLALADRVAFATAHQDKISQLVSVLEQLALADEVTFDKDETFDGKRDLVQDCRSSTVGFFGEKKPVSAASAQRIMLRLREDFPEIFRAHLWPNKCV